jgi:ABC-type transporter Mla subunit MlaD
LKRLSENRRIIELKDERSQDSMTYSVLEQMGDRIDETAQNASRTASAVADALGESVTAAGRAAKHGSHAATELLDNTKERFQRHPIETFAVIFAAGIAAGAVIASMVRRRQV